MLADQPARKVEMLVQSNQIGKFMEEEYLPQNWEEDGGEEDLTPDTQETEDRAIEQENQRTRAEETWANLTPEIQNKLIAQLQAIDTSLESEELHLLDRPRDSGLSCFR